MVQVNLPPVLTGSATERCTGGESTVRHRQAGPKFNTPRSENTTNFRRRRNKKQRLEVVGGVYMYRTAVLAVSYPDCQRIQPML